MVEQALVIEKAKKQRSHFTAVRAVSEAANDTVGCPHLFDLHHGALARFVGPVAALCDDPVERLRFEPAVSERAGAMAADEGGNSGLRAKATLDTSGAPLSGGDWVLHSPPEMRTWHCAGSQEGGDTSLDQLELYVVGRTVEIPLPVAADRTFSLPRDAKARLQARVTNGGIEAIDIGPLDSYFYDLLLAAEPQTATRDPQPRPAIPATISAERRTPVVVVIAALLLAAARPLLVTQLGQREHVEGEVLALVHAAPAALALDRRLPGAGHDAGDVRRAGRHRQRDVPPADPRPDADDDLHGDGERMSVITDHDGSLTGTAGATVTVNVACWLNGVSVKLGGPAW